MIVFPSVVAAFCAAENTEEKKLPPPCVVPVVASPFSCNGVSGAEVMFDNLLGPNVDPDLILRCDIMFPDAEVTTFGFTIGSEEPRSLWVAGENSSA